MRMQSFGDWLIREVAASRMALISAYEKRDHLLYVEAPPLRKRYMDAIGTVEEGVLQAELKGSAAPTEGGTDPNRAEPAGAGES